MRSRAFILASLVVLAATVLVIGVAVAGAGQSSPLPDITAPDLLAKMAQTDGVTAVSGEISWTNDLFGDLGEAGGMVQLPAQSPLTSSGSGRIWVSDAGARVESQGGGGDQIVVLNKAERTAWVYDYAQNTVKKVVVTGQAPVETASPAPSAVFMTPAAITLYLQQVARFATVEVAGQAKVAGRDAYLLRMTPVADDTALGYVQAAIDGDDHGPAPALRVRQGRHRAGPPLRLRQRELRRDRSRDVRLHAAGGRHGDDRDRSTATRCVRRPRPARHEPTDAQKAAAEEQVQRALLTKEQVEKLVPYDLAWARDYEARPFRWGYVFGEGGPLTASGDPLMTILGAVTGMDAGALRRRLIPPRALRLPRPAPAACCSTATASAPSSSAQTKTTPDLEKQLQQLQQTAQILGTTTVGGVKAQIVGTPLGGVIVWQQGDTTLVAGGMVPMSDLEAFASSVR